MNLKNTVKKDCIFFSLKVMYGFAPFLENKICSTKIDWSRQIIYLLGLGCDRDDVIILLNFFKKTSKNQNPQKLSIPEKYVWLTKSRWVNVQR